MLKACRRGQEIRENPEDRRALALAEPSFPAAALPPFPGSTRGYTGLPLPVPRAPSAW